MKKVVMKKVVNVVGLMPDGSYNSILIQEVPNNWRQCSVSGEWRPLEDFGLTKHGYPSRNICDRVFNMNRDSYYRLYESFEKLKKSNDYKEKELLVEGDKNLTHNTMKVSELIELLNKLNPDDLVCMTQSGDYAEGERAEIFAPKLIFKKMDFFGKTTIYSIGHSSQYR